MFHTSLTINGTEYKLAVNITGAGVPGANISAEVGMIYMDTNTGKLYKCTGKPYDSCVWEEVATGISISKITESTEDGGSNVVTFSDGKTLTIKNGNRGADGKDGKDGKDGTTVTSIDHSANEDGGYTEIYLSNGTVFTIPDGKDYVLTEDDKQDIADLVLENEQISEIELYTMLNAVFPILSSVYVELRYGSTPPVVYISTKAPTSREDYEYKLSMIESESVNIEVNSSTPLYLWIKWEDRDQSSTPVSILIDEVHICELTEESILNIPVNDGMSITVNY